MPKPSGCTWSTDENYASGPDVGTPTKVDRLGHQGAGHIPDRAPAQFVNWWKNRGRGSGGSRDLRRRCRRSGRVLEPLADGSMWQAMSASRAKCSRRRRPQSSRAPLASALASATWHHHGARIPRRWDARELAAEPGRNAMLDLPPRSVIRSISAATWRALSAGCVYDCSCGRRFSSLTITPPVNVLACDGGTANAPIVQVTGIDHDVELGSPLVIEMRAGVAIRQRHRQHRGDRLRPTGPN